MPETSSKKRVASPKRVQPKRPPTSPKAEVKKSPKRPSPKAAPVPPAEAASPRRKAKTSPKRVPTKAEAKTSPKRIPTKAEVKKSPKRVPTKAEVKKSPKRVAAAATKRVEGGSAELPKLSNRNLGKRPRVKDAEYLLHRAEESGRAAMVASILS